MKCLGLLELQWHRDWEKSCRTGSQSGSIGLGDLQQYFPTQIALLLCATSPQAPLLLAWSTTPGHCWLLYSMKVDAPRHVAWEHGCVLAAPPFHCSQGLAGGSSSSRRKAGGPHNCQICLIEDFRGLQKDTGWYVCVVHVICPVC